MKKINDTTLSADNLDDVKPKILIGGKDSAKFVPNINMSFLEDEFYFNLNRKEKTVKNDTSLSVTSDKAELGGDDTDIFYEKDGRLKWDIRFSSQPADLKLTWEIKCSKGLEFYFQDELSEEEKKEGCFRPDDIIGSYAVYCNKKHNKYKTGKLFHIPRPFVIDSNGSTEWCVISIADGSLTITLPETFMDNAAYPVTLDPTFGYTSSGGSYGMIYPEYNNWGSLYNPHTAISGDILTQLHLYVRNTGTAVTIDLAAYTITSGHLDSRLSSAVSVSVSTGDMELRSSATISYAMAAGSTYGLAFGNGTGNTQSVYDDGTGYSETSDGIGALPETWSHGSFFNRIWSIYATYTEGATTTANNYYYRQNQ